MEKDALLAFIKYGERPIEKSWIIGMMIANIIALIIGTFLSSNILLHGIANGIISLILLAFCIMSINKRALLKSELNLLYGIYTSFLSISLGYVSYCLLLKAGFPALLTLLILFSLIGLVGIISYCYIKSRINKGKYINQVEKTKAWMLAPASIIVVCTLMYRTYSEYLTLTHHYIIFGILIGGIAVLMPYNLFFIMKYFCYQKIKKIESTNKVN